MEALLPRASGQLLGDEGDVKLFCRSLCWRDCNSGVVALKSLRTELFWKSCFGKQLTVGAAPEAMDVRKQMCVSTAGEGAGTTGSPRLVEGCS